MFDQAVDTILNKNEIRKATYIIYINLCMYKCVCMFIYVCACMFVRVFVILFRIFMNRIFIRQIMTILD